MKFKVINGEPLQFHNQNGDLTGTIQISSSGDMIIRPESGSNNIIIGDATTTSTVEFGTVAAPVTLDLLGGGTITSNGNTLNIGSTGDTVRINNAIFTQSLQITGSLRVSGSAYATYFVGDGSGLTNVTALSASYASTASYVKLVAGPNITINQVGDSFQITGSAGGGASDFPYTGSAIISGSLDVTGSANLPSITGSLFGTASWSRNATTASFVTTAQTASYVLNAVSASFATSASRAVSASFAPNIYNSNGILNTGRQLDLNGASLDIVGNTGTFNVNIDDTLTSATISATNGSITIGASGGGGGKTLVFDPTSISLDTRLFVYTNTITATVPLFGTAIDLSGNLGVTGSVGIGKNTAPSAKLDVSGSVLITGSLSVTTGITGSLLGTASYALNAGSVTSASYATTASYAATSSYAMNGGVTQLLAGPNVTLSPTNGLGQVTVSATLSGSAVFNTATGSYGSFYDTTTQTNVASTARSMSFNTTDITNGVSISGSTNPFNTYIKTTNAGVYDIQFSAQVDKTDSGTDEIWIWLRKNGSNLADTATSLQLVGNGAHYVAAWNWFVNSAANDYYQIMWYSPDANVRLHAESGFGVVPGIPSVIVTANRVDQFLSNTGSFSGSFNGVFTGSLQGTASYALSALNAISASYSETASYVNPLQQNVLVTGSLIVSASGTTNDFQVGTNKLFVSASGNVGIGTLTPTQPLQVAISGTSTIAGTSLSGSALLVGTINNGIGIDNNELYNAGNEFIIGTLGSNGISFRPNSTPRMVISSSGDVGIGIASPTAKLHINNLNAGNSFLVEDSTNPDSTPFVIDASGNVGIGTLTPISKLTVSASGVDGILIGTDTSAGNQERSGRLLFGQQNTDRSTAIFAVSGAMHFSTLASASVSSGTTRMYISESGNVGIGTTTPLSKLTIQDTLGDSLRISVTDDTKFNRILFQKPSQTWSVGASNANDFVIGDENAVTYRLRIQSGSGNWLINTNGTGSVSIGTTSTTAKLHVNNTGTGNSFLVEDDTNPDSSPFVIDNLGAVAIGQTSSLSGIKLTVNGTTLLNNNYLCWTYDGASNNDYIVSNDSPHGGTGNTPGFYVFKHDSTLSVASGSGNSTLDAGSIWMNGSTQTNYIAGNVGIGITTPSASLHVNNTSTSASFLVEDSTNPDSSPFVIDNAGNVAIGTGSAFEKVTIQNGNIALKDLTNSTPTSIVFTTSDTSSRNYITTLNSASATDDYMKVGSWFGSVHLTTGNITSSTTHLFVSRSGNIGVGITSSLNAKLHVNNTSTGNSFLVEDSTNPDATPFVIDASGNVGIGTTTPTALLHISSSAVSILTIERSINANAHIQYKNSASIMWAGLAPVVTNTYFGIGSAVDLTSASFVVVSGSGNVGIGTTSPNARLDVSGSAIITGSVAVTQNITASAFATTDALITSTTTTINSGITTIYSIPTASYDGAWFDYTIRSGSNARAGSIMGIWSGSAVNYAETTTTDFGNTSGFELGMSVVGANMILSSSATTSDWSFNAIVRSV